MHVIVVPILTAFTSEPMRTTALLHELVRRAGGDVTITQAQIDAHVVEPGSEKDRAGESECLTFELGDYDEKGLAQSVRVRIVDEKTAIEISERQHKIDVEMEAKHEAFMKAEAAKNVKLS